MRLLTPTLVVAGILAASTAHAQSVSPLTSYSLTSTSYTQTFDSLAATGTSNALPAGFQIAEFGTAAAVDGSYAAGTGSGNAGNAYSFGATGSTDRALGSLTSGTASPIRFGGIFSNGLGTAITSLAFSYTGEQWRLSDGTGDLLTFEYSTDATSLTTGTWVRASALDFLPLFSNGTSGGTALNGNLAANQRAVSGTIAGLSIDAGSSFGFRWSDTDVSGGDQGLAIDNLSLTAGIAAAAVPEPSSWAMMLVGFGGMGTMLRRRRRAQSMLANA